jgi:hypothetical protein
MAPSGVGRNELLAVTRRSAAVIFSSRSSSKPTNETGPSLAEMDAFRSRTAEPGDIIITSLRLVSTSGSAFAPCTNDRGQIIQWVVSPTVFEEIYSSYEVDNPADGETQYGKVYISSASLSDNKSGMLCPCLVLQGTLATQCGRSNPVSWRHFDFFSSGQYGTPWALCRVFTLPPQYS